MYVYMCVCMYMYIHIYIYIYICIYIYIYASKVQAQVQVKVKVQVQGKVQEKVLRTSISCECYFCVSLLLLSLLRTSHFSGPRKPCWQKPCWQIYAHGLHGYVGASAQIAPLRQHSCFS